MSTQFADYPNQAEIPRKRSEPALLVVNDLSVSFRTKRGDVRAVSGVSFELSQGEILGVVGESGCGKSTLCSALVNNLPSSAYTSGSIYFRGQDVLRASKEELKRLRGREITTVLQNPMTAMDPLFTVGQQFDEILAANSSLTRSERRATAVDMLTRVYIPSPQERLKSYPHQMSGGMKQRALIACATALRPSLLLADEPTTALDVTVQEQILNLLGEIRNVQKTSIILITHDLGVVRRLTDRVIIMYAGHVVESGDTEEVFSSPQHPYTQALIDSIPRIGQKKHRLTSIEGSLPDMSKHISGCAFSSRCSKVMERCTVETPPLFDTNQQRTVRCWLSKGNPIGAVYHDNR
jgi:oligopeptide/dipeptide ABC transporter ATP-binding protein